MKKKDLLKKVLKNTSQWILWVGGSDNLQCIISSRALLIHGLETQMLGPIEEPVYMIVL